MAILRFGNSSVRWPATEHSNRRTLNPLCGRFGGSGGPLQFGSKCAQPSGPRLVFQTLCLQGVLNYSFEWNGHDVRFMPWCCKRCETTALKGTAAACTSCRAVARGAKRQLQRERPRRAVHAMLWLAVHFGYLNKLTNCLTNLTTAYGSLSAISILITLIRSHLTSATVNTNLNQFKRHHAP